MILEVDPSQYPVHVSNMDVMDYFHKETLHMYQVGAFDCIVPSTAEENFSIICIKFVLPIVWIDSPKFVSDFSGKLMYMENPIVNMLLLVSR